MSTYVVEYKNIILDNIMQGKTGIMLLRGTSMLPTISDGAILYVCSQQEYYVGDIIVFSYPKEGYIVHRIIEKEGKVLICKGDNTNRKEVIMSRQIIGKVIRYFPEGI